MPAVPHAKRRPVTYQPHVVCYVCVCARLCAGGIKNTVQITNYSTKKMLHHLSPDFPNNKRWHSNRMCSLQPHCNLYYVSKASCLMILFVSYKKIVLLLIGCMLCTLPPERWHPSYDFPYKFCCFPYASINPF